MATERIPRRADDAEPSGEWLSLTQARAELDVMSEDVVRTWAEWGWLRSRRAADGQIEVLRADVLREKQVREGLGALGGEDLTPEELEELHNARPGRLPWERDGARELR